MTPKPKCPFSVRKPPPKCQGFFADSDFHALIEKHSELSSGLRAFRIPDGWRKGEIASLRWPDLEGDVVRLRGENAKNGEGRSVTLSGDLADLMERRKAQRQVETKSAVLLSADVFHQNGEQVSAGPLLYRRPLPLLLEVPERGFQQKKSRPPGPGSNSRSRAFSARTVRGSFRPRRIALRCRAGNR